MGTLMGQHAVIIHAVWKLIESRHIDRFGNVRPIECAIAAVPNLDSDVAEKRISVGDAFVMAELRFEALRQFAAVNLFDVENGVALGEQAPMRFFVYVFARLLFVGTPIDHGRTMLALANLATKVLPLLVRSPQGGTVALALGLRPQHKSIDTAIWLRGTDG